MNVKITKDGQELTIVHLDTNDFGQNLVDAYIHTLFDQVEKQHGIRENFLTYNGELLLSLARALAVILYNMEKSSISDNDNGRTKDEFIKLLNEYYVHDERRNEQPME